MTDATVQSTSQTTDQAADPVHAFIASRRSQTIALCRSAAPASQGSREAFSTGSQNQKPPQPSS